MNIANIIATGTTATSPGSWVPHTPPLRVGLLLLGGHYFCEAQRLPYSLWFFLCELCGGLRPSPPQALTVPCKPMALEKKKGTLLGGALLAASDKS
jgi:hypothetical protein